MNHEFLTTLIVSLVTGPGGWGLLQLWLSKKQKDKDAHRAKQDEDSKNWYRESREHYKTAKEQAEEARKECGACKEELRIVRNVFYLLLEELEDRIIPMLEDPARKATRDAVHNARSAL